MNEVQVKIYSSSTEYYNDASNLLYVFLHVMFTLYVFTLQVSYRYIKIRRPVSRFKLFNLTFEMLVKIDQVWSKRRCEKSFFEIPTSTRVCVLICPVNPL